MQGFVLHMSLCGGTGSGLGALIVEHLASEYKNRSVHSSVLWPSGCHAASPVVETYNAILALTPLLNHSNLNFVYTNKGLRNYCEQNLRIESPGFTEMNSLLAKATLLYL